MSSVGRGGADPARCSSRRPRRVHRRRSAFASCSLRSRSCGQEEPVERLRRLDVDRRQTADARAWAVDAFAAGARTVILVPAMPVQIATMVIEAIGRSTPISGGIAARLPVMQAITRFRDADDHSLWTILRGVSRARERVMRFKPPTLEDDNTDLRGGLDDAAVTAALNELALEITVFTRSKYFSRKSPFTGFAPAKDTDA